MSIGEPRLSWAGALEQMSHFSAQDHPAWLLTHAAQERLRQALAEERKLLVTKSMGS